MTRTGEDKLGETPMAEAGPAPLAPACAQSADPVPRRLFWPSPKTVRHVVVEVLIVTVGVLLALGIDQLRQHFTRLAQADEARQMLRAEFRRNLEGVDRAMRNLPKIYNRIEAKPEEAPLLTRLVGQGMPFPFDTAYTVALENGALAYLPPEERSAIEQVYRSQAILRGAADSYRYAYWEMNSFPAGKLDDAEQDRARLQQVKRVLNFARATFILSCRQMAYTKIALGEWASEVDPLGYCEIVDLPSADVEALIAGSHVPIPRPSLDLPEAPN